mmetsp:Transcript_22289/g.52821  ORF Transcript_22289/g.52821 Transcript_22289/m.52821 type:complete len:117 (-) Transcript_22289:289-639(-)
MRLSTRDRNSRAWKLENRCRLCLIPCVPNSQLSVMISPESKHTPVGSDANRVVTAASDIGYDLFLHSKVLDSAWCWYVYSNPMPKLAEPASSPSEQYPFGSDGSNVKTSTRHFEDG